MVGIGAITPDEAMEDYLRMAASLPERDFSGDYGGGMRREPWETERGMVSGQPRERKEPDHPDPAAGKEPEPAPEDIG